VYHKISNQSGITWIRWDLGRDNSIDIACSDAVAAKFEENMSMGEPTLLELDGMDTI
jgi:hypothetical protein